MKTLRISKRGQAGDELVMLRKAVEASGEAIFLTDSEGLIIFVNPEFERVYGYRADEVVNKKTPRILKSSLVDAEFYENFWTTLLDKKIVKGEIVNRCKDGRLVTIEGSANPILDQKGNIIGFLAIQRDISQRKKSEEKIDQRNKEIRSLYAISSAINQFLDLNKVLNSLIDEILNLDFVCEDAHCLIFLVAEKQRQLNLVAHRGALENHPCLLSPPAIGECLCGWVIQHGEPAITERGKLDTRHTRKTSGMNEHIDICLPLTAHGKMLGALNLRLPSKVKVKKREFVFLISVVEQIGVAIENAQLFKDISNQNKRLRELTARLSEVEEKQKRQLADELHDQIGQNLTALGININIIQGEALSGKLDRMYSCIQESQVLIEETAEKIRDLMVELRPQILDEFGLLPTLHWYGNQFASRFGIKVDVQSSRALIDLPASVETALFKITQEALTNVAKHANANKVSILLECEGNHVRLVISDNGIGFNPDYVDYVGDDHGWGLTIMEERSESVGGRLRIVSLPDFEGCRLVVDIDL